MSKQLPARPHLRNLQNQAKRLLKGHRERTSTAVRRLRAHLGRFSAATTAEIVQAPVTLRDAQEVIAHEYGFANWTELRRHVEISTGQAPPAEAPVDELALLLQAMEAGDVPLVEAYLQQNPALVHTSIDNNDTLLHRAEQVGRGRRAGDEGDLQIAQLLIDHGADIDAIGGSGDRALTTALDAATWAGNIEMVQLLLANGADPNKAHPGMPAPVGTATSHLRKEIFLLLIGAGADYSLEHTIQLGLLKETRALLDADPNLVNEPLPEGHMPLTLGAGQQGMFKLLVRRGADIHARDPKGFTPLLAARAANNQKAVEELLGLGVAEDIFRAILQRDAAKVAAILEVDPSQAHAVDEGPVPLLWAIHMGSQPIVELLLAQGVEVNIWRDSLSGVPSIPLSTALFYHYDGIAQLLLDHGALANPMPAELDGFPGAKHDWRPGSPPESKHDWRDTPLSQTVRHGTLRGMEMLLDHGAEINHPLPWLFGGNDKVKFKQLLDRGLDLRRNNTHVLFEAVENGDVVALELMITHGVDMDARDERGRPLLDVMRRRRHPGIRDMAEELAGLMALPAAEADRILRPRRRFIDAVIDGATEQARDALKEDPSLLNRMMAWVDLFHLAAGHGHQDLADVLVEYGTPWTIHAAAALGRLEVVDQLLNEDASRLEALYPRQPPFAHLTPLMVATAGDHVAVVKYLLDRGADIDRQTPRTAQLGMTGMTALHVGVEAKAINALEVLLDRGADIDISNDSGRTPFMRVYDLDSPMRDLFRAYGVSPEDYPNRFQPQAPRKNRKDRRP